MINSIINLGLPTLPPENIPKNLFSEFLTIYNALRNLADGVSRYAGVDGVEVSEWSQATFADTFRGQNLTRLYPIADVPIAAGQMVNLYNSAGNIRARLARANAAGTMAHGVAMTAAAAGQQFEMYWLRGFVTTVSGMVVGTLYWLSDSVAGGIQNANPVAVGTIRQPIGLAVATNQLLMDIPLDYQQN